MDDQQVREIAAGLFDAIESGDVAAVGDLYTEDVEIWHNYDDAVQNREQNLATLAGLVARISDRKYDKRQVEVFADGFIQQHVLRGVRADGVQVAMPGVLIGRLRGDKIARLDEYLDSAHVAQFRQVAS
ncbi:MAG: nuclear transport factor 2 family protein [Antricoccus sp.]